MAWIWQQVAVNAVSKNLNDRAAGTGRLKGKKAKQQLVMQAQQQQQSAAAAAMMQLSPSSSSASNTAGKEVVWDGRWQYT